MTAPHNASAELSDAGRLSIEHIRQRLYQVITDCKDMNAQRVIYRINVAKRPTELWLLRSELHQCIARVHNQSEASRRINGLLDAFEGWVPPQQLKPISETLRDIA